LQDFGNPDLFTSGIIAQVVAIGISPDYPARFTSVTCQGGTSRNSLPEIIRPCKPILSAAILQPAF
jgi:hypothetical protein